MVSHTAVHPHEAQTEAASRRNRAVNGARSWHALDASLVTRLLDVDPNLGLTPSEVTTRRLRYGPNNCENLESPRLSGLLGLLSLSIAIGFLLAVAVLNSAITDNVETFALIAVVVVGAIVGFTRLLKAARAHDVMQYVTRASVRVRRNGYETIVKAEEIVPGDIIILTTGDSVPADARLIETGQLQTQESVLTGKSTAVDKRVFPVAIDASIDHRQSMVYLGTNVLSGRAAAAVVTTGVQTALGQRAAGDK